MSDRDEETFTCPVVEVTVLEDRALVKRAGALVLEAGRHRVRIEDVSPVIVDATLLATASGARVANASVERRTLHREADAETSAAALATERRHAEEAFEVLQERITREESALAEANALAARTAIEISEDVSHGHADAALWRAAFQEVAAQQGELRESLARLHRQLARHEETRRDLDERAAAQRHPSTRRRCSLVIDVVAGEAGEITLEVEYVVAAACWRPQHRATLTDTLRFETDACVWQRTGEDWNDVRLLVSTERASLGTEPPALSTDLLRVRRKSAGVQVEAREEVVETTGLGAGSVASELPGVDDGGQTWLVKASERASVPTDGRPHRVSLSVFEAEAEVGLVVRAERITAAVLRARVRNEGTRAVLAGPVDLIRDHGPVGRTSVGFIAPGERFELGFGPEPDLRVRREEIVLRQKTSKLTGKTRTPHRVTLRIGNLGDAIRELEITERVPVSEVEAVEIEVDRETTTSGARPDRDGFVSWNHTLAPRGTTVVRLDYTVSKKRDVSGI